MKLKMKRRRMRTKRLRAGIALQQYKQSAETEFSQKDESSLDRPSIIDIKVHQKLV